MVERRRLRILIFDSLDQKLQIYIDIILARSISHSRERRVRNSAGCVTASRDHKTERTEKLQNELLEYASERERERDNRIQKCDCEE